MRNVVKGAASRLFAYMVASRWLPGDSRERTLNTAAGRRGRRYGNRRRESQMSVFAASVLIRTQSQTMGFDGVVKSALALSVYTNLHTIAPVVIVSHYFLNIFFFFSHLQFPWYQQNAVNHQSFSQREPAGRTVSQ